MGFAAQTIYYLGNIQYPLSGICHPHCIRAELELIELERLNLVRSELEWARAGSVRSKVQSPDTAPEPRTPLELRMTLICVSPSRIAFSDLCL